MKTNQFLFVVLFVMIALFVVAACGYYLFSTIAALGFLKVFNICICADVLIAFFTWLINGLID